MAQTRLSYLDDLMRGPCNWQQLVSASAKVSSGAWHTLTLRAEGDRLSVSFDGKPLLTQTDRTFTRLGKVALWTKADSVTHFDQITITPLEVAAQSTAPKQALTCLARHTRQPHSGINLLQETKHAPFPSARHHGPCPGCPGRGVGRRLEQGGRRAGQARH